jgi:hypothetical protein
VSIHEQSHGGDVPRLAPGHWALLRWACHFAPADYYVELTWKYAYDTEWDMTDVAVLGPPNYQLKRLWSMPGSVTDPKAFIALANWMKELWPDYRLQRMLAVESGI